MKKAANIKKMLFLYFSLYSQVRGGEMLRKSTAKMAKTVNRAVDAVEKRLKDDGQVRVVLRQVMRE